jgi:hypothetical protein
MQLLKSHVFKTVQSVWFWCTLFVAHILAPTKCISVLVPLRKRSAIPVVVHIVMPSVYHIKFIDATPVNKSWYSALSGL